MLALFGQWSSLCVWTTLSAVASIACGEVALPGSNIVAALEASRPAQATASTQPRSPEGIALLQEAAASPPETLEDVEARWLGAALDKISWALTESPLTLAQKAAAPAPGVQKLEHDKPHRAGHKTLALSLMSAMGVISSSVEPFEERNPYQKVFLFIAIGLFVAGVAVGVRVLSAPWSILVPLLLSLTVLLVEYLVVLLERHTLFGGIPAPLIIPVLLGIGLACLIQIVSLHSELKERQEKLSRGEPLEADLGY